MNGLPGVWRSLWRFHALLAAILVLEYALAFAILLTAGGVLFQRMATTRQPSGVVERGLYIAFNRTYQRVPPLALADALQRFQAVAGADHVALGSGAPFVGFAASNYVAVGVPGRTPATTALYANAYSGGLKYAKVLGLRLVAGRWFHPDEAIRNANESSSVVVLSASLAQRLFHGQKAIGHQVTFGGRTRTVIGVVNPLAAPGVGLTTAPNTNTFIVPNLTDGADDILIRYHGTPGRLHAVYDAILKHNPTNVMWGLYTYPMLRAIYFRSDRRAADALAIVVVVVLITALCGILGLTGYWIAQRRKQIAIRRALGANKRDVMVHFMGESSVLVVLGLAAGIILNFFLSSYVGVVHFEGGIGAWLTSIALVLAMAAIVIYASLRRWLRLDPAALIRLP